MPWGRERAKVEGIEIGSRIKSRSRGLCVCDSVSSNPSRLHEPA